MRVADQLHSYPVLGSTRDGREQAEEAPEGEARSYDPMPDELPGGRAHCGGRRPISYERPCSRVSCYGRKSCPRAGSPTSMESIGDDDNGYDGDNAGRNDDDDYSSQLDLKDAGPFGAATFSRLLGVICGNF